MFGLPSLYAYLIGGAMLTIVGFTGGYALAHKLDSIPYNQLAASKAALQAEYSDYKQAVAANSAKASAAALAERTGLEGQISALETKLAETQRNADAKSKQLLALLASAKPGDIRPIGPVASDYYRRLRDQAAGPGHSADPGNP